MANEWMVRPRDIAGRRFFEVYKIIHQTGDVITRGGLWETTSEAQKLADNLNKQEYWRAK